MTKESGGYARPRMPAEWEEHQGCVTAYPHLEAEWGEDFDGARSEIATLCRTLVEEACEGVHLLVASEECERSARAALGPQGGVEFHRLAYGDSWLRDTGPIVVRQPGEALHAAIFRFDGWGGKYRMAGDEEVGALVAERLGLPSRLHDFVLEGGAIDVDGDGCCLTTESCLLDGVRNEGVSRETMEARLMQALGVVKVIWLERGLLNDHTDGHIDTLARFVGRAHVICMEPASSEDPNSAIMREICERLEGAQDARGRRLKVTRIPSPGLVEDASGEPLPASYANFYIGNRAVLVPTYGSPQDDAAIEALAECFPGRRVLGSPARHILRGGGALHCVTQQIPRAEI